MTEHYVHVPTSRRRRAPTSPIDLVLIAAVKAAADRTRSVETAAGEVLVAAHGSARMLQRARVKLLTKVSSRLSDIDDRALAMLAIALTQTRSSAPRRTAGHPRRADSSRRLPVGHVHEA